MQEIWAGIEAAQAFVFVISPDSVSSPVCQQEVAHAVSHHKRIIPVVCRDVEVKAVPEALAKLNWIFLRERDDFEPTVDRLIEAIDTDLDWTHSHTRLLVRAREWENGRDESLVLRGQDLQSAEEWLLHASAHKESQPTALQTEYIVASRKSATRRQRFTLGSVVTALIIAIGLAFLAWSQRNQAKTQQEIAEKQRAIAEDRGHIALSRQLAAQAANNRDSKLDVALLLGVEASRAADTMEARQALLAGLERQPGLVTYLHARSVAFSPDGKLLAVGRCAQEDCKREETRFWDLTARAFLAHPLQDRGDVTAFAPEGGILAFTRSEKTIIFWDIASGQPQGMPLETPYGTITKLFFAVDGKMLVSQSTREHAGQPETTLAIWDVATRELRGVRTVKDGRVYDTLAISADGHRLAVTEGGQLFVLDLATDRLTKSKPYGDADVAEAAFSPDGKILAAVSNECGDFCYSSTVQLWDLVKKKPLGASFQVPYVVHALAFSPDGHRLATGGCVQAAATCQHGAIDVWAVHTSGDEEQPHYAMPLASSSVVSMLAFQPKTGEMLVSRNDDGTTMLWRLPMENTVVVSETSEVSSVYSRDGQFMATAACVKHVETAAEGEAISCESGVITLQHVASQKRMGELPYTHQAPLVPTLALSPDGKLLAVGFCQSLRASSSEDDAWHGNCLAGAIQLWNTASLQPLGPLLLGPKASISSLAFSPNSQLLASGSCQDRGVISPGEEYCGSGEVRLWDVETRNALATLTSDEYTGGVYSLAFSEDGTVLASGSCDQEYYAGVPSAAPVCVRGKILVWHLATRQLITRPLLGHAVPVASMGRVTSLALSHDGTLLASSGGGSTIVWDILRGQRLGQVVDRELTNVAFTADNTALLSGSTRVAISRSTLQKSACRIANRDLTSDEWHQYMGNEESYHVTCSELIREAPQGEITPPALQPVAETQKLPAPSDPGGPPDESPTPIKTPTPAGSGGREAPKATRVAEKASPQKNLQATSAPSAESPQNKPGDTYLFESVYPDHPTLSSRTERQVLSAGQGAMVVAFKDMKSKNGKARTHEFTPEWNLIRSHNADGSSLEYSPPLKYFAFPLYPGKTWQHTSTEHNTKTGAVREHAVSATVGDWEEVTVPAGTFRAIKITLHIEVLNQATAQKSTGVDVSWYAPALRRSVKTESTGTSLEGKPDRHTTQLVQYNLK
jgi:WD40 repeat protein